MKSTPSRQIYLQNDNRLLIFGLLIVGIFLLSACRIELNDSPPEAVVEHDPVATVSVVEADTLPVPDTAVLTEPNSLSDALPAEAPTATPEPMPTATATPVPSPTPALPANVPPDSILIPAIELESPVSLTGWSTVEQNGQQVSVWDVPENAAGWHKNSALPGHGSNVVLSGHHNMGSQVFRYLADVEPGDEITLHADGRDYLYTVIDHFILPERDVSVEQQTQNAKWIMPTVDERLTLVTCWPYNDNSHRVIVIAKPVSNLKIASQLE